MREKYDNMFTHKRPVLKPFWRLSYRKEHWAWGGGGGDKHYYNSNSFKKSRFSVIVIWTTLHF